LLWAVVPHEGELCQVFNVSHSAKGRRVVPSVWRASKSKGCGRHKSKIFCIFYFTVVLQIIKETNDKEIFRLWLLKTLFWRKVSHLSYLFCWRKFSLWREPLYKFKASIFWNVKFSAYWTSWKDFAVSVIKLIITEFEWLYCWLKQFCVGNKWQGKSPMIMSVLIFSLKAEQ